MAAVKDLTNTRFGMLVAQYDTGKRTKQRNAIWHCVCDCGNEVDLASNSLINGNTRSCGCIRNGGVGGGIGGGRPIDVSGHRYGMLTAVKRVGSNKNRDSVWLFSCDCGGTYLGDLSSVKAGEVTNCGCRRKAHDKSLDRLYCVYHGMKARCYNKNHSSYKWYGALGVKVCQEWLEDFGSFSEWALANGYDATAPRGIFTLDRIDPYGDYEPSNCRWLSIAEQQRNKRALVKA